ncbi:MAG TPA: hypothetical protein VFM70_05455 [Salinimicrobium sp.]|nr:hypothetical protein [Salinimicrobium sp.]
MMNNKCVFTVFLLVFCCQLMSCQTEKREIISDVYQEVIEEFINNQISDLRQIKNSPPNPPGGEKSSSKIDIKKSNVLKPLAIIINTELFEPRLQINRDSILPEFSFIAKNNPIDHDLLEVDTLKIQKKVGHQIFFQKNFSELSETEKTLEEKAFVVHGTLNLGKIIFNTEKDLAYMEGGYRISKLNGIGFSIFLEKKNGTWKIIKITTTSVS